MAKRCFNWLKFTEGDKSWDLYEGDINDEYWIKCLRVLSEIVERDAWSGVG